MGIYLFQESRKKRGWSETRITQHLAIRGFLFLIIQHLIENPAWIMGLSIFASPDLPAGDPIPGVMGPPSFLFGVITALGLSMILMSLLRRLPIWAVLGLGFGVMLLSQAVIPGPEASGIGYAFHIRLLAIPGLTPPFLVMYPLIP